MFTAAMQPKRQEREIYSVRAGLRNITQDSTALRLTGGVEAKDRSLNMGERMKV